jgi:hypothetical protein
METLIPVRSAICRRLKSPNIWPLISFRQALDELQRIVITLRG